MAAWMRSPPIMECPKCHHDNPRGSRYCLKCGGELQQVCPACRNPLPPDSAFCNACGHDQSKPVGRAAPAAPEGERRQATVLFSDLTGYTEMNERLDPEEV